ncbi:primase-like DNA-binding domain-containing protein, partial [Streptomyces sp. BE147]|uniref:primase-like DNA-binding domain-containing protein n=1 Tax=Streptomyces sp. BE147 TaxID=3002524 RepID=UPI002E75FA9D
PETVRIATTAYAETEDHTGRFLNESCTLQPHHRVEQAHLYNAYKTWCAQEDTSPVSSRAFAVRVRESIGLADHRVMLLSNQRKYYPGIGLLAEHEEPPERG